MRCPECDFEDGHDPDCPVTLARTTDPETSKKAARELEKKAYEDLLLAFIEQNPGWTPAEITEASAIPGAWKRISGLVKRGDVIYRGTRKSRNTGKDGLTCYAAEKQGTLL